MRACASQKTIPPVHISPNYINPNTVGNISGSLYQLNKYLKMCFLSSIMRSIILQKICQAIDKTVEKSFLLSFKTKKKFYAHLSSSFSKFSPGSPVSSYPCPPTLMSWTWSARRWQEESVFWSAAVLPGRGSQMQTQAFSTLT